MWAWELISYGIYPKYWNNLKKNASVPGVVCIEFNWDCSLHRQGKTKSEYRFAALARVQYKQMLQVLDFIDFVAGSGRSFIVPVKVSSSAWNSPAAMLLLRMYSVKVLRVGNMG